MLMLSGEFEQARGEGTDASRQVGCNGLYTIERKQEP